MRELSEPPRVKERYFTKVDQSGGLSRYDLPSGEKVLGWMGHTGDLVTLGANRKEIRVRKLPI